jgi:hypothetical protein
MPPLLEWLHHYGVPALLSIGATYVVLRIRRHATGPDPRTRRSPGLQLMSPIMRIPVKAGRILIVARMASGIALISRFRQVS